MQLDPIRVLLNPIADEVGVVVSDVIQNEQHFSSRLPDYAFEKTQEGLCVEAFRESEVKAWIVAQADRAEYLY